MNDSIAAARESYENAIVGGDLSGLTVEERSAYYSKVCETLGLNPYTQPFEYLKLNGKTILYARRACTDQLRQIHKVSITIAAREHVGDCFAVTARATLPSGRTDESVGAVPVRNLNGEALANAIMKAETKAKRRVTLAICGLAVLDESELDGVPNAQVAPPAAVKSNVRTLPAPGGAPVPQPPQPHVEIDGEEQRDLYEKFVGMLQGRVQREALVDWVRMVLSFPDGPNAPVKLALSRQFATHCRYLKIDGNELVAEARSPKGGK